MIKNAGIEPKMMRMSFYGDVNGVWCTLLQMQHATSISAEEQAIQFGQLPFFGRSGESAASG